MTPFLFRRNRDARTYPQDQPVTVPANVTTTTREDGIDWVPPDAGTVAHIDAHLPGQPSDNLRIARTARVLSQEAAYLTDTTGKVPAPSAVDLVNALQFAAEVLRDAIVIGRTP